jgi:tRNA threonylcarbamoyladenosine biosynthesis protein TsaE
MNDSVTPTINALSPSHTRALPDEAATRALADGFARQLKGGIVVSLHGELGAGKTAFVRAVLRALGETGPVKSPTYALVETYHASGFVLHHIDFYRLDHPLSWRGAGLEACFTDDAVVLMEWPEKADELPAPDLVLRFFVHDDSSRTIELSANSERGAAMQERWLRA